MEFYALVVLAVHALGLALIILINVRVIRAERLPLSPPSGNEPTVSVIVAALNEEGTIEEGMRSLLALDYPALEIIAVNDRSTDNTGAILERLAAEANGRLRVLHIHELPEGWLGKCNAMRRGAAEATGRWLLFTDADVLIAPEAVRAAFELVRRRNADHVVLLPHLISRSVPEAALLNLFSITLAVGFQFWRIESRSLRSYVGVGAFNMVRHDLYRRFGGHELLRMEVADDMKLGYLVKKFGGRTALASAGNLVRVRWREGTVDIMRGVERSGFAGMDFSYPRAVGSILLYLAVVPAPFILPLLEGSTTILVLSAAAWGLIILTYAVNADEQRISRWTGLLHPLVLFLFIYALIRSVIVTTARGGLQWRDTFYSIAALRKGSRRVMRARPGD